MGWKSPSEAMPWVGLYICLASLLCTLAMAADAFQGFRKWKLWFPCRFFTVNAATITLLAIAMKLPVDLSMDKSHSDHQMAKYCGMLFFLTMLANFLPSLGLMGDKELLINIVGLGILIITIIVNVCIEYSTQAFLASQVGMLLLIFPLVWVFSVALTVPVVRKRFEHQYNELHRSATSSQEINISYNELIHHVKKYWMMAQTSNPQFAIACSPVSSAFGVMCSIFALYSFVPLLVLFDNISSFWHGKTDYRWSITLILVIQSIGTIVGSIAPIFRSLTAISHFNISKKWSKNLLNVFRVEKHWTRRLQMWKGSHISSHIPGHNRKKVFRNIKDMTLNVFILLQITVVVICKTICLIPRCFLILFTCCWKFCKSFLKGSKEAPDASNSNVIADSEEYTSYVLQIEPEAKLSERMLRNTLRSVIQLLHESEEKEPTNLMKLLKKSTGFFSVEMIDNVQVPSLHQEETFNCWSLVLVTLTAIALALPKTAEGHVQGLVSSIREGLQFVRHIEESLNANGDLVKGRKAARRVWTDVDIYGWWLHIDLQKKARKGKTSKEILQWLGDEAIKFLTEFMRCKQESLDQSLHKFIAASSMHRITRTMLLDYHAEEKWPKDEELFNSISTIIADLLYACFTNLPRVIAMKCHDNAIGKREESIRTAAQLLGKSKRILMILETRQLPNLDLDSMAYIDKWHGLPKTQIPDGSSSANNQPAASSSSTESIMVTIM